jgi:hypothetical protein
MKIIMWTRKNGGARRNAIITKRQIPKPESNFWSLIIGNWLLFGYWDLVIGIWVTRVPLLFNKSKIRKQEGTDIEYEI